MTFDDELQRTLDSLSGRLREEVGRQVRIVGDELAAAARAEQLAIARAPSTGRLAEGIRAISAAQSLGEVLDTLLASAGHEAARPALLLVRGDRLLTWRDAAFDGGPALDIARADAGAIAETVETAAVASSAHDDRNGAPPFAQLPEGRQWISVPIAIAGQVVAILYADEGIDGTLSADAVEILTRHAAQRLEALTAIKAARSLAGRPVANGEATRVQVKN